MPLLRLLFLLFLCVAPIVVPSAGRADGRVALVIGNSSYPGDGYLPNAAQDARDVSAALRRIGFDVHDGYDLTRIEMLRLTADVTAKLSEGDVALFYFSGHGVQIGAENFVIPVDAHGATADEMKASSVSLQAILKEMELRADTNIIILDACRNNPFTAEAKGRSLGSAARGLAKVDAGIGSYIAFSTQPGNVALDGAGRNSPFTSALLRHITSANDDLHELMRKVRGDVVRDTGGAQVPWENSSLIERVYLSAAPPAGAVQAPPATTPPPPVQAAPATRSGEFTHVVSGLDPNGDYFLALRNGTTSGAQRIAKMSEGTRLVVLGAQGSWLNVRTETGLTGWAHSNWITALQPRAAGANQCDALWYQRNAFFARHGYCFRSARGQAAFPNANCNPGLTAANVPLSRAERAEIARIKALETSLGCS